MLDVQFPVCATRGGVANLFCLALSVGNLLPKDATAPRPPLNGLRAFEAAGRTLNFRRAAEDLGVTQGAVAQQVRGLESRLGIKLFVRGAKTLVLTDTGRRYHRDIARAFAIIDSATAALSPQATRLTISVTPTFAAKWLIPRLPAFTARCPDVDLRILATESLSSFHSDGIDLAVRQSLPPFGASLDVDLLFEQYVVAVCGPHLLEDRTLPLAPEDLRDFALLHDPHNLWPGALEAVFGQRSAADSKGMRFSQTSLAIDAAIAGQGIALASLFLAADDLAAGRLQRVFDTSFRGPQDFYLLSPRSRHHAESLHATALQTVRAWLLETAGAEYHGL